MPAACALERQPLDPTPKRRRLLRISSPAPAVSVRRGHRLCRLHALALSPSSRMRCGWMAPALGPPMRWTPNSTSVAASRQASVRSQSLCSMHPIGHCAGRLLNSRPKGLQALVRKFSACARRSTRSARTSADGVRDPLAFSRCGRLAARLTFAFAPRSRIAPAVGPTNPRTSGTHRRTSGRP